ncbi:MAG TPA: endonuclease/exonuclease/phosphatase family protein [Micromonosporaceae bacterium]|nr:endonuclease/exonuclease/phosphatase family protein [Micromonosporaceae bacterium]
MADELRLRVLSYNVHGQRDDLAALGALVRDLAPDIAIIQEAPRRFRWRQRCAQLARNTDLLVAAGGLPSLGNLVLTGFRVRPVAADCRRYPLTPGRHLRGSVFVRCVVGRTPFVVAGSHLSTDPEERVRQARLLAGQLAEVEEPLVFGGDLNETPDGTAWHSVAAGLVDAAVAGGAPDAATFPSRDPQRRLDVIMCDPRWKVVDYRVVDGPQARAASDHLPVVADLILPATP